MEKLSAKAVSRRNHDGPVGPVGLALTRPPCPTSGIKIEVQPETHAGRVRLRWRCAKSTFA